MLVVSYLALTSLNIGSMYSKEFMVMENNSETVVNLSAYNEEIKRILLIVANAMKETILEEYKENYEVINEMSKELLNKDELHKHNANDIYTYHIERCKYNFVNGAEDSIEAFQEIFLELLEQSNEAIKKEFQKIQNNNKNIEMTTMNLLYNNKQKKLS